MSVANAKDYYELVVTKLRAGLLPAFENGRCRYRTQDGKACMMGICIPDEKYTNQIEGFGINVDCPVSSILNELVIVPEGMTYNDLNLLQIFHDTMANVDAYQGREFSKRMIVFMNSMACFDQSYKINSSSI